MTPYSQIDLQIWERLFGDVPAEWRQAPPSQAMQTCAVWLREAGTRSLLDVGCGVGRWSVWLARQGFQVWGADFAPKGVEYARRWAEDEGLNIPFACAPVTERPFPERRFDAVVAALVLDLVPRAEFELATTIFRDLLNPSGHLFAVFNPNEEAPAEAGNPTEGITKIRYSDAEVREIVEGAGFTLVRQEPLDLQTRGFLWKRSTEIRSNQS